jgi:CRP/FNR family transcriptional regulator, dissimilatory nitrate respiration regulator
MYQYILSRLEEKAEKLTLFPNHILFQEGQPSQQMYCVEQGVLMTYKQDAGKTFLLNIVKQKQVLGLTTLKSKRYEYSAKTLSNAVVSIYQHTDIQEVLDQDIHYKMAFIQELCKEVSKIESQTVTVHHQNTKQRIASILLEMLDDDQEASSFSAYSLEELSEMLGSSHKNFHKTLNELYEEGYIRKEGNQIVVLNRSRIKALI